MMKKILFASLLLASFSAHSQNFYIGADVGQSSVDIGKSDLDAVLQSIPVSNLSSSSKEDDTAYGVSLGYQFHPNWAAELGYVNLGKTAYSASFTGGAANAEIKASGWTLALIGSIPVTEQLSLFGRIGMITANVKASGSVTGPGGSISLTDSEKDTSPLFGAGLGYALNKQIGLRGEYIRYNKIGSDNVGSGDVDVWSVGLTVRF